MKNEFVAKLDEHDGKFYKLTSTTLDTYYCSGESKIKDQDLCINLPKDGGQIVVNTVSLIKLLKKYKRI